MRRPRTGSTFVPSLALALVLAACTSGSPAAPTATAPAGRATAAAPDVTEPPPEQTPTADAGPATPASQPGGGGGSFTVNGTDFAISDSIRCIADKPDWLDLGLVGPGATLLLKQVADTLRVVDVEVQGPTITEMFGDIAFSAATDVESTVAGDRWTGSAADLEGAVDDSLTVDVTWDVIIPADAIDCSL